MRRAGGPSPPEADLEALREQLRRLGYLKGPFSGWLFHGQAGRWAWLRTGARASLRAGMLGGPLLAVPAAIGVAIAHWPQISAPRDLLGLFAYLVLVLGGGLALLEFLTDVVLVGLARRGLVLLGRAERLAGRLGLLFTI
ncbi:MAG: hypothetical protein ACE5HU_03640, partial [Acidobacteriota bacterium]